MCDPANLDPTHSEMKQLLWRCLAPWVDDVKLEHRLPNGRIADLFYWYRDITVIIEVKTILRDSLARIALEKYGDHADYLIIACPAQFLPADWIEPATAGWPSQNERFGLWFVDWQRVTEIQRAQPLKTRTAEHPPKAARPSPSSTVIGSAPCTVATPYHGTTVPQIPPYTLDDPPSIDHWAVACRE